MKEQTISYHREEVTYDDAHWERLSQLRTEAARVMEHLAEFSP
jgi:predicted nucleotidyltransferase